MSDILKYGNAIRLAQLASDPSSPENGVLYYNTTDGVIKQYIGGSWEQVPDQALTLLGLALNDGEIIVGNASNVSAAVDTDSVGDVQADHSAGLTIKSGVIVDGQISASAAISLSKLAALTASRALVSDGSGVISVSAVTSTELGYVSGVTSSIQTQINAKANDADVIKKDGSVAFTADQSMGGFKLTSLAAPTSASDAATKGYVDNALEGLRPKEAVRVATTANITIASDLNAGDVIDGVTLVSGDRVLVKNQTAAENNGIYIAGASPARSSDFDSLSPIDEINKAYVAVQEGTENAGKLFVQFGTVTTLGTDPINFTFFNSISGLVGGDGITVSGSNISVDHDGEGLQFVATQLSLELDGSTLSKSASGLKVADGGISNTQINASAAIDATKIADGSVTNTEFQYIGGLTSDAQTQLNGKANTALSNLASTAVNVDIIPDTNNARNLGSASLQYSSVRASAFRSYEYASALSTGDITSGSNVITNVADTSGFAVDMILVGPGFGNRNFITAVGASTITVEQNATATNVGANISAQFETPFRTGNQSGDRTSGAVILRSGNTANGKSGTVYVRSGSSSAGDSGDIYIGSGSAAGTRGSVYLDGSVNYLSNGGEITANNQRVQDLLDPTQAQDAATKAYVDAITTTDVAEGTNLYFTDERAQDAVGTILTDSSSIDFTYSDGTPSISAVVLPAGVDHDALQNFVANEHVDHSTVQIATAANTSGLTGGGDITATRNLSVDINGTTAETSADNADKILIYDNSATALRSMTRANFLSGVPVNSAGDINESLFTGLLNNTADQVITGFSFNNAVVRSFKAQVSIVVDATSDLFAVYELMGIQRGADWQLSQLYTGDTITSLSFNITSAGQVRVTIGNISGFSSATIKFRAQTTSV